MWIFDLDTVPFSGRDLATLARYGYTREEFQSMTILGIRPGRSAALWQASAASSLLVRGASETPAERRPHIHVESLPSLVCKAARAAGVGAGRYERNSGQKLREYSEALAGAVASACWGQESESGTGRELHDEIGQNLTGLQFFWKAEKPTGTWPGQLDEARVFLEDFCTGVRIWPSISAGHAGHLGLLPALLWFFDRYRSKRKSKSLPPCRLEGRLAPRWKRCLSDRQED